MKTLQTVPKAKKTQKERKTSTQNMLPTDPMHMMLLIITPWILDSVFRQPEMW
jgi:hypothetical protein